MKPRTQSPSRTKRDTERDGPQGPPLRPSDIEDIPGLPPFDPEMIDYNPGGLETVWYWVRGLFRRRPRDRAA